MSRYFVSRDADVDLDAIWAFIARDNFETAERVDREFSKVFESLARMPEQGYRRRDLSKRLMRFFPLYSYLIIYQPVDAAIQILAVIHGNRNLKRLLKERLF
jgi:plasmid stabilization system protein ParE